MASKLVVTGAPYPTSPPPFEGMDSWHGAVMVDPVTTPAPGQENRSAVERASAAGVLRDADAEARTVYSDGRPRAERLAPGTPPQLRPPGVPDRGQRHPLSNWGTPRQVNNFNPHDGQAHGRLDPANVGAASAGSQQPGLFLRRNTHRLAPEPWDAGLYLDAGAAGVGGGR